MHLLVDQIPLICSAAANFSLVWVQKAFSPAAIGQKFTCQNVIKEADFRCRLHLHLSCQLNWTFPTYSASLIRIRFVHLFPIALYDALTSFFPHWRFSARTMKVFCQNHGGLFWPEPWSFFFGQNQGGFLARSMEVFTCQDELKTKSGPKSYGLPFPSSMTSTCNCWLVGLTVMSTGWRTFCKTDDDVRRNVSN